MLVWCWSVKMIVDWMNPSGYCPLYIYLLQFTYNCLCVHISMCPRTHACMCMCIATECERASDWVRDREWVSDCVCMSLQLLMLEMDGYNTRVCICMCMIWERCVCWITKHQSPCINWHTHTHILCLISFENWDGDVVCTNQIDNQFHDELNVYNQARMQADTHICVRASSHCIHDTNKHRHTQRVWGQ